MSIILRDYFGTLGYIPKDSTIAQKKIVTTLRKEYFYKRFNMPLSRSQFIIMCVRDGSYPRKSTTSDDKEVYYMQHATINKDNKNGLAGWLEDYKEISEKNPTGVKTEITKTEYNFALYLVDANLCSRESIEAKIKEELAEEKRETARLEAERLLREESEKLAKESERAFKLWLQDAVFKYKDFDKLQVVKNIFLKKLNNYDPRFARETCVLIDNFDNPLCKAELISRLHIHNKASRLCFEYITGLNLPSTQTGTDKFLKGVTKASFKGHKDFPINVSSNLKECYTLSNNGWFCTSLGKPVEYCGRNYYIIKQSSIFMVADGEYFTILCKGESEDDTFKALKELIRGMSIEVVVSRMQGMYSNYEIKEAQVEQRLGYSLGNL